MLVEHGTLEEIRHLHVHTVEASYVGTAPDLGGVPGIKAVQVSDGSIRLQVTGSTDPLLKRLAQAEVPSIQMREPSLEELFHAFYDANGEAPRDDGRSATTTASGDA